MYTDWATRLRRGSGRSAGEQQMARGKAEEPHNLSHDEGGHSKEGGLSYGAGAGGAVGAATYPQTIQVQIAYSPPAQLLESTS